MLGVRSLCVEMVVLCCSVIKEKLSCKGSECPPTDDMTRERRETGVIPIWSVELSQSSTLYLSEINNY